VDGYEILAELGRGGMGVVYQARQHTPNRIVALKMILTAEHAGPVALARFRNEAEALARLRHPNIVHVYAVGEQQGRPYFTLEYVDGGSLARRLDGTPLPPRAAAGLVETLARAVHAAHEAGVIHRDLKPANVLLTTAGEPRIADFGLAKRLDQFEGQTESGAVVGTPSYMAPEQATASHHALSPACDIYALGAILYECLTGRPPFRAATPLETVLQVAADDPVPPRRLQPKTPRDLETVCLKCLHKQPGQRYASALALAEDLRRYLDGRTILARPAGRLEKAWRWCRRHPARAALAAALALCVLAGTVAAFQVHGDVTRQELRAAHLNKEVRAALEEAEDRLGRLRRQLEDPQGTPELLSEPDKWSEPVRWARAAWERARHLAEGDRELLGAEEAAALRRVEARLEWEESGLRLAAALDRVRLRAWDLMDGKSDPTVKAREYPEVFAAAGLAVKRGEEEELAARIKASPARPALLAALDDWAVEAGDETMSRLLLEVARLADPGSWQDRFRDERLRNDRAQLDRLAEDVRVEEQSPQALLTLAQLLHVRGGQAAQLLRRAVQHHLRDYYLYLALGRVATDPVERAGWLQAALAVRPRSVSAHNNLGTVLRTRKYLSGALRHFRTATVLEPRSASAHSNLGLALQDSGDQSGALRHLRTATELDPKSALVHYNLANVLRVSGDRVGAVKHLRIATELDPDFAEAHGNLGAELWLQGDRAGALAAFRTSLRLDPSIALSHRNLGMALFHSGDRIEAVKYFRAATELNPNDARAHFWLGFALLDGGDRVGAVKHLRAAIELDARDAQTHFHLGLALRQGGDQDGAVKHLRAATDLNPKDAKAHFNLGLALRQSGDRDAAIKHFRAATDLNPNDAQIHHNLGVALLDGGDRVGAVTHLRAATELAPNDAKAHYNLGLALSQSGDQVEAVKHLRTATERDPKFAEAHNKLAVILWDGGDRTEAVKHFRAATELNPNDAKAHFNLGYALRNSGDRVGGVKHLRTATELNPNDAKQHSTLGAALLEDGDLVGAVKHLRTSAQLDPKSVQAQYTLGRALLESNDPDGAVKHLRAAIELEPKLAQAHLVLGRAFLQQGRIAEARDSTHRAAQLVAPGTPLGKLTQQQLQRYEQLLTAEGRLNTYLDQGTPPGAAEELLELIDLCRAYKQYHATAARLGDLAFTRQPPLAEDLTRGERYRAARSAALAAAGQARDPGELTDGDRARLRAQALTWLRADLRRWQEYFQARDLKALPGLLTALPSWQTDPAFAAVRAAAGLDRLPADERKGWAELWADVGRFEKEVGAATRTERFTGSLTEKAREQTHAVPLQAGRAYVIDLESRQFNASLRLHDGAGKQLVENDGGAPNNRNVRLVFTAPADDTYRFVATSVQQRGTGGYTLTVRTFIEPKQ
jgi:serine/threonine-protein kinase